MNYTFEVPDDISWGKQNGETLEIGSKMLVTDKLTKRIDEKMLGVIEGTLASAMARGIIDKSLIPLGMELMKERDPFMKGTEYNCLVHGVFYPFILPKALALQDSVDALTRRLTGSRIGLAWKALRGRL